MGLVTPVDPVPLSELGRVHFVGIGGAGMSGIARIMLARGVVVSGSDTTADSVALSELAATRIILISSAKAIKLDFRNTRNAEGEGPGI